MTTNIKFTRGEHDVAQYLIGVGKDHKTIKGVKYGYLTGIMYLQPSLELCPYSTEGCRSSCLWTSGRGQMTVVQKARQKRTADFKRNRQKFFLRLIGEIILLQKRAIREKMACCVRLNGTSDIDFTPIVNYFEGSECRFYDYTKNFWKVVFNNQKKYYLVYSRHEHTKTWQLWLLKLLRKNSAVVFKGNLPKSYKGIKVIDGDESDLRFLDPKGVIVGLHAKGRGKKDTTGFAVEMKGV